MTDTIQDRLRDQRWNSLGYYSETAHEAAAHIDAQDAKIKALVGALSKFVDAVDRDIIQVRPSEREQFMLDLSDANTALSEAKETA